MKMTLFALAGPIGFLGARGLTNFSPAVARLKNPSADRRPVRATEPKPAPTSQRNSRRVRPQNCRPVMTKPSPRRRTFSIQVHELVRIQNEQTVLLQCSVIGQFSLLFQLP